MRLPTCFGVRRTPVFSKMWSATNLLRIGKRPSARVDLLSDGRYFSRPSMRAASRCGGQTASSLPLRLLQHLREFRMDLTAASVPVPGVSLSSSLDGEAERGFS